LEADNDTSVRPANIARPAAEQHYHKVWPYPHEYEVQIHNLHYQWYLRARQSQVAAMRKEHTEALKSYATEADALLQEKRADPLTPEMDDDMGWDNPSPAPKKPEPITPAPPVEVVLIGEEDYISVSRIQYAAYVAVQDRDTVETTVPRPGILYWT
jgi:hypothetical protein